MLITSLSDPGILQRNVNIILNNIVIMQLTRKEEIISYKAGVFGVLQDMQYMQYNKAAAFEPL